MNTRFTPIRIGRHRRLLALLGALLLATSIAACSSSNDEGTTGITVADFGGGSSDGAADVGYGSGADMLADMGSSASADTGAPGGNTNVNLGGSGDFGFARRLLDDGIVPHPDDLEPDGFFAEHHTPLPTPDCGERVCLQAMLGVMSSLISDSNCTLLQLGLNSPIEADPDNRPPLTLAVVVDVSGSMSDAGKITFVQAGLELLVDSLRDDDQIAIITYESDVSVPFEMQTVELRRAELRSLIQDLRATGGTDLHGGLRAGYREVLEHYDSGRQNRVILLSDGQPTSGITEPATILAMSSGYNSDGVGLTTVGLGTSFNIDLMRGLAQQADGNFYFVEDAGAVDEVFTEEISYFTVPVAFDLELEVTAGEEYEFGQAYGSAFWRDTEAGGRLEVPSVFLAHRVSHDDVTDSGGRRGGGSALLIELAPAVTGGDPSTDDGEPTLVATVDVSFREPGSDEVLSDRVVVMYPHPSWKLLGSGYFDAPDVSIIQKSFVMLNIYVAIESACRAFHLGQPDEALGVLERIIAAVEDFNEELDDTDMSFDLELLQQLEQVIRDNSQADVPDDWEVEEDPWPAD